MEDRFKFRIWNKTEMHYNDFVVTATGYVGKITEEFLGKCVFNQEDLTTDNECILMQCTGLKDMSDKLIYEGDILNGICGVYWGKMIVKFDENRPSFYVERLDKKHLTFFSTGQGSNFTLEVIGNIYENPELLEA